MFRGSPKILIYLLMTVLALHCSTWALSSCDERASHCSGFSCCKAPALGHMGFSSNTRAQQLWLPGSIAVAHELSCFAACGIFPDQGSNPCLLHGQEDSLPLSHQRSPIQPFFICDCGLVELNCRNPSDLAKVDRFKSWHSLSDELFDLAHVIYL